MYNMYVSPVDGSALRLDGSQLVDGLGNCFPVDDKIPNFIFPKDLPQSDKQSIEWYRNNAQNYDDFLPLTFQTFGVDEDDERQKMLENLDVMETSRVLEIGCGTGRDSEKIASELGSNGELYLQDISLDILDVAVKKFKNLNFQPKIYFSLANAYYLPFEDNYFDRVFHFGGLNTFGDVGRAFREIIRVCKPGGRVVVGDENMPVWLRNTEFGCLLMNSNPHYKYSIPFEDIPIEARNVKIEWIIGGVFYVISFDVGTGEPKADFDFAIPGQRGGTHRTRYYGQLEGVSQEAVELAKRATGKSGKSMYEWLDNLVKAGAKKEIED